MSETLPNKPSSPTDEKRLQGHWLLAKMGKKVLRPGGLIMTTTLLNSINNTLHGATIIEFGPGVGKTASLLLGKGCSRYIGVDPHSQGSESLQQVLARFPQVDTQVIVADAKSTGLPNHSADLVIGEAMLSMLSDEHKKEIITEASRLLKPNGYYIIHELGLTPDNIDENIATSLKKEISRTIKVGARPLTMAEWQHLLINTGLQIEYTHTNAMHLLEPKRILSDEGIFGTLRIMKNMICNKKGRQRMMAMRNIFRKYNDNLCAIGIVARKVNDAA